MMSAAAVRKSTRPRATLACGEALQRIVEGVWDAEKNVLHPRATVEESLGRLKVETLQLAMHAFAIRGLYALGDPAGGASTRRESLCRALSEFQPRRLTEVRAACRGDRATAVWGHPPSSRSPPQCDDEQASLDVDEPSELDRAGGDSFYARSALWGVWELQRRQRPLRAAAPALLGAAICATLVDIAVSGGPSQRGLAGQILARTAQTADAPAVSAAVTWALHALRGGGGGSGGSSAPPSRGLSELVRVAWALLFADPPACGGCCVPPPSPSFPASAAPPSAATPAAERARLSASLLGLLPHAATTGQSGGGGGGVSVDFAATLLSDARLIDDARACCCICGGGDGSSGGAATAAGTRALLATLLRGRGQLFRRPASQASLCVLLELLARAVDQLAAGGASSGGGAPPPRLSVKESAGVCAGLAYALRGGASVCVSAALGTLERVWQHWGALLSLAAADDEEEGEEATPTPTQPAAAAAAVAALHAALYSLAAAPPPRPPPPSPSSASLQALLAALPSASSPAEEAAAAAAALASQARVALARLEAAHPSLQLQQQQLQARGLLQRQQQQPPPPTPPLGSPGLGDDMSMSPIARPDPLSCGFPVPGSESQAPPPPLLPLRLRHEPAEEASAVPWAASLECSPPLSPTSADEDPQLQSQQRLPAMLALLLLLSPLPKLQPLAEFRYAELITADELGSAWTWTGSGGGCESVGETLASEGFSAEGSS